jgi:hypothetical protein
MATIDDLRALGYTIGIASGCVQTELDALCAAREEGSAATIAAAANEVTALTVRQLDAEGRLPDTAEARLELAQQIAASAIDGLTARSTERVAFHERAVEEARKMPTVWHFAGPLVNGYIQAKDDGTGWDDDAQEAIDALADPEAYAERSYQAGNSDCCLAATTIASRGVEVTRPKPGEDVWEAEGRTFSGEELVAFSRDVAERPTPPTTQEKVTSVLVNAPELGEATRAALLDALS